MSTHHNHAATCRHEQLAHCEQCKCVYCKACGREWKDDAGASLAPVYPWYPTWPGTGTYDPHPWWYQPTVTCGEGAGVTVTQTVTGGATTTYRIPPLPAGHVHVYGVQ